MGNEESRPDTVTFSFETPDGTITINAKKIVQGMEEADREFFNLTDKDKLVKGFFKTEPLAPYMCSFQTKHYDLYWGEVNRTLYPLGAKIVKRRKKLVTVTSMELSNTSKKTGKYTWTIDKSEIKRETVKRKWFADTEIKSNVQIAYKIMTLGSIDFSRKTTEEEETEQSKTSKLSSQTNVEVTLKPHQSVLMKLQAIHHSVDIEVEYEASLSGVLRFIYKSAVPIKIGLQLVNDTLKLHNEPTTATYKEIITLEYYTDGDKISMTDIKQ